MRASLIQQAQLVAQGVNLDNVRALTGSEADLHSPGYLVLKDQLTALRFAYPQCRFLYLLGQRADQKVFFFVDSEPSASKDCSPAGQIYDEAPSSFRRAFAIRNPTTEGPYTDRWGKWISAAIPILDPQTVTKGLASADDARQIVREAVAFYRQHGREAFLKEINNPHGKFCQGDLYTFVFDRKMTYLAHPVSPELVGQNLIDQKDWSGGKYYRREIQAVARLKNNGWVEYEKLNPVSKELDHKQTYFESADDLIICAGAYAGGGSTLAELGMDVDARDWNWMLARAALPPVLLLLFLMATVVTGAVLFAQRTKPRPWQWRLEPVLAIAVGLAGTTFVAWIVHKNEVRNRAHDFRQLAVSRSQVFTETLHAEFNTGLEGLAHFYENSSVTPEVFNQFTVYLTKNPAIKAWEWCQPVLATDKDYFETAARTVGLTNFAIWQQDASGNRVPVTTRPVYYPVTQVAPMKDNELDLGYDLGSDPQILTALTTAAQTGLPTATDPLDLDLGKRICKGIRICRPVFDRDDSKRLHGFAVAAVRMESLLKNAAPDYSLLMELSILRTNNTPELVATTALADNEASPADLAILRPVFAFEKVFAVTSYAGPDYLRLHPLHAGWLALLTGLVVTVTLAIAIAQVVRRREALEHLVAERTVAMTHERDLLQALMDNVPDLIYFKDGRCRFTRINLAMTRHLGLENPAAAVGKSDADFFPPREAQKKLEQEQQLLTTGTPILNWLEKSNSDTNSVHDARWLSSTKVRTPGVHGETAGLVGISRDITEAKRQEDALRKFSLAIEQSPASVVITNCAGNMEYVNPKFCQLTGYTAAELIGQNPRLLKTKHTAPEAYQKLWQAITNGQDWLGEFLNQKKNGELFWESAHISPVKDALGKTTHFLGIKEDITERKLNEAALQTSLTQLKQATDRLSLATAAGNVGIWEWDVVNNKLVWDDQMFALYGIQRHQFGGAYEVWKSALHPADKAENERKLQMALRGELEFSTEFRVVWPDGSIHNIRANAIVVRDAAGQSTQMIGTNWDITAQKQVEANLELATIRANAANVAKSEFLANMSHEIRTPLNGVLGMLTLLRDTNLTTDQSHFAKIAQSSGESLLEVINDILDFSKIEAGKLSLEIVDFSLHNLLDNLADAMALRAHEKGLLLGCVVAPEVTSRLQGDPGRLRQILTNLTGNAIKFTAQGQVIIRVGLLAETAEAVQLHFGVHDTGIGIPADKVGKLFTKFTQVDSSTTRLFGGTGLGLAISKQLVEIMGGEIGIRSEFGKGSEFWFTIRLPKQPAGKLETMIIPADLRGVRVLIVDDHAINREILRVLLGSWGMRPAEVSNGPAALAALTQARVSLDPFALAILDMEMPGMDGATLGSAIKADPQLATTPLVMFSSLGQMVSEQRMKDIGFVATLHKPVHRQKMQEALALAIGGKTAAATQPKPAASAVFKGDAGRGNILLVEDNLTNQMVALGVLKKLGLKADVAGNGLEAVTALSTRRYDLVFMDAHMPEMDGLQATQVIRDPQSAVLDHEVPIIAMTARAMPGDREKCLKVGMNDYLTKPIELPALVAALEKWLKPKDENRSSQPSVPVVPAIAVARNEATPVFDRKGLLDRMMEDEEFAHAIIESFLSDMPGQILQLKQHAAAGETKRVEQQAHKIRGAAANIGGESLCALTAILEQAGKAGDRAVITTRMLELDAEFAALTGALKLELQTKPQPQLTGPP